MRSHLLPEKVSDPRSLALKADELCQSRVSSFSVNLLSEVLVESLQVNLVSSRTRPPKNPLSPDVFLLQLRPPDLRHLPEPAGSIRIMVRKQLTAESRVPCWKTSSPAGGNSCPTCQFSSSSFSSRGVLQFFSHLPEGHPVRSRVLGGLWRLCVPGPWAQSYVR